jgi:hypothetical protein
MDLVTGKSARQQSDMAAQAQADAQAAQAEQRRLLDEQNARLDKIEEGQRRVREGGGRGLLAFIDKDLVATFGGGR